MRTAHALLPPQFIKENEVAIANQRKRVQSYRDRLLELGSCLHHHHSHAQEEHAEESPAAAQELVVGVVSDVAQTTAPRIPEGGMLL
jgi:hypothetical protein